MLQKLDTEIHVSYELYVSYHHRGGYAFSNKNKFIKTLITFRTNILKLYVNMFVHLDL